MGQAETVHTVLSEIGRSGCPQGTTGYTQPTYIYRNPEGSEAVIIHLANSVAT